MLTLNGHVWNENDENAVCPNCGQRLRYAKEYDTKCPNPLKTGSSLIGVGSSVKPESMCHAQELAQALDYFGINLFCYGIELI